jgi:4-carboxymuconolactone decarboxylase
MGDLVQEFGSKMRYHSSIPNKLNEMAIIITARYWTSHYEWWAHKLAAQKAGLDAAIIDAIATGRRPERMQPDERAVYDFATEILQTKQVTDATFAAAKQAFGERGVVDLMGVISYYQIVSMALNVDRHPLPAGVAPELRPLP